MASWKAFITTCIVAAVTSGHVNAQESHTITLENFCGFGTPFLKAGGQTLSTGQTFRSNGPIIAAIAFLQNDTQCGDNGENCLVVETTLRNATSPGSGSSADLSLIPPHKFSVKSGFRYHNGCDEQGKSCDNADCITALHQPNDTQIPVECQAPNTHLSITFC